MANPIRNKVSEVNRLGTKARDTFVEALLDEVVVGIHHLLPRPFPRPMWPKQCHDSQLSESHCIGVWARPVRILVCYHEKNSQIVQHLLHLHLIERLHDLHLVPLGQLIHSWRSFLGASCPSCISVPAWQGHDSLTAEANPIVGQTLVATYAALI